MIARLNDKAMSLVPVARAAARAVGAKVRCYGARAEFVRGDAMVTWHYASNTLATPKNMAEAVLYGAVAAEILMQPALKERLVELGHDPRKVLWGRRLQGDIHGITLSLPDGSESWCHGPASTVRIGDQVAIIRFG